MSKWLELLADFIVWFLIIMTMIFFIYGIFTLPFWASVVTSSLLLAAYIIWD